MDEDKNELDVLIDTCEMVSFAEFSTLKDPKLTFFTRRGFNSNKVKFTQEIDWNEVYNRNPDIYINTIKQFILSETVNAKRSIKKHALKETPDLHAPSLIEPSVQHNTTKTSEVKKEVVSGALVDNRPDLHIDAPTPKRRGRPKKNADPKPLPEGHGSLDEEGPDLSAKIDKLASKLHERAKKAKPGRVVKEKPNLEPAEAVAGKETVVISDDESDLSDKRASRPQRKTSPTKSSKRNARHDSDSESEFETADDGFDDDDSDFEVPVPEPEVPKKQAPTTPRKKRKVTPPETPTPRTPKSASPRKNRSPIKDILRTPTRRIFVKAPRSASTLPQRPAIDGAGIVSQHQVARGSLHVSTVPDSLPCRENEFSQIFLALESAINAETGSCIYVSGTPGTGKTATVREVISQLQLRCQEGELPEFSFIEINGMKLINPLEAYETLWEEISGQRVSSANAVALLEKEFKVANPQRVPVLVLMDEMDQLVTKSQGVMYNFFNWPTFRNSKLVVVAVANTMDLPERMLSNKISSRLGLTRIQFPGYNHDQLREIIESRLIDVEGGIVEKDAIEFASRKVASVSGDARRALDICRRAVELAQADGNDQRVKISHVKRAIDETTNSPMFLYLQGLPLACKIFLSAVLARIRRSGVVENSLGDILEETQRLCKLSQKADKLLEILYGDGRIRMKGFLKAVTELVEGGVLVQQSMRGERSARIRLTVAEEEVKTAFKNDKEVEGMI